MELWKRWWEVVWEMRSAFSRLRGFLWFATALAALCVRPDLKGVTSLIRALGLRQACYDRMLDFFHSPTLHLERLTQRWTKILMRRCPGILVVNQRILLVGDGIKIPKEGKKMPAVKSLYQSSENSTKAPYIMGHSCQSVALLAQADQSVFAIPLASRIHEGIVWSNRDQRTLLDKMILLLESLELSLAFYFIADAYYATQSVIRGLLKNGNHLITRVRKNAVAYHRFRPLSQHRKRRGRPRLYGPKIYLRSLLENPQTMETALSPIYGEKKVEIRWRTLDLLWRPVGRVVRFVAVLHPQRGRCLLMTTDLTLPAIEIIRLYGLRFKIECSFKQALRTVGTYAYHFWMKIMTPLRKGDGNQYLHRKTLAYRQAVKRKLAAYHCHIQLGVLAQGLLQYLSVTYPKVIWSCFGSWLRTIRPGVAPSEQVTALALRNTLPEFLTDSNQNSILTKFILERIDFNRAEGIRLII